MRLARLLSFVWNHPLNASGRWRALGRLVRWQVASRILVGPIALPFVDETFLFSNRGMTGVTGNWYCGLHEAPEMAFVLHLLRPGDLFLDVGANVGSYTILAGGAAGARVMAIEPIPETFRRLELNLALNGLSGSVKAFRGGLSDESGARRFTTDLDTVNHVLGPGENLPSIDVPVWTLDDLVGSEAPLLIKIDVEGHEWAVLRGGDRTLGDPRLLAVVMETNGSGARYGVPDSDLISLMAKHGFSPAGYDPFTRILVEAPSSGGNTLFVRDGAQVAERVQGSKRYRLVNGTI